MSYQSLLVILGSVAVSVALAAEGSAPRGARKALQPFNDLIGSWKGTGIPEGTREEKEKGLWIETMHWVWQFKDKQAWLQADFAKGKYFARGELRYLPDRDTYQLSLWTTAKQRLDFTGKLRQRRLLLERKDATNGENQRLVITLLHSNRFLYTYEVKAKDRPQFHRVYQVGATKKGVAFATGDGQPECVVSGGLGTIQVSYQGKTYYVCCSGCRAEFNADPGKYVKEYEERKAKEK